MDSLCYVYEQEDYNAKTIAQKIEGHIDVKPGQKIFVKPNWVMHPWNGEEKNWTATVTNPAMIEAVLLVLKQKMQGKGTVLIGDAPMTGAKIEVIWNQIQIDDIINKYQTEQFHVQKLDLRMYYWHYVANTCVSRRKLKGDPSGYFKIQMGKDSLFAEKTVKNYMVTDTEHPISEYHDEDNNVYVVSRSIIESDVFINLPKLKTHRLAGMTCAMKNLVGTIGIKNCVPHSTYGSDKHGGDSFPEGDKDAMDGHSGLRGLVDRIERRKIPFVNYCMVPPKIIYNKFFRKKYANKKAYGAWYGNDTVWRSVIDLNRILMYSDKEGKLHDKVQRQYICIVDSIIAGEKEGPLHPTPKKSNRIFVGKNPVALDAVACKFMGFDYRKMPVLFRSFELDRRWPLVDFSYEDIKVCTSANICQNISEVFQRCVPFIPSEGWKGHIEHEMISAEKEEGKLLE